MKKYKSLLFLIVAFFIFCEAGAQIKKPGFTLGFSAFYANPQNDLKATYKGGLGGEVKGGVGLGKTYLVASMGYSGFAAMSGNEAGTLTTQSLKIGLKQYFLAKRLFINGDVGVVNLKDKLTTGNERRFSRDIGVGARLLGLEASVFYDTWDNLRGPEGSTNTILFKLGYNLTL